MRAHDDGYHAIRGAVRRVLEDSTLLSVAGTLPTTLAFAGISPAQFCVSIADDNNRRFTDKPTSAGDCCRLFTDAACCRRS